MKDIQTYDDFLAESYTPNTDVWYVAALRCYNSGPMFFKRGPGGFVETRWGRFDGTGYVPGDVSPHAPLGYYAGPPPSTNYKDGSKTREVVLERWNGRPAPQTFYVTVDGRPLDGLHTLADVDKLVRKRTELHAKVVDDNGYSFSSTRPISWVDLRKWIAKGPPGMYTGAYIHFSTKPVERHSEVSFS